VNCSRFHETLTVLIKFFLLKNVSNSHAIHTYEKKNAGALRNVAKNIEEEDIEA
jgi:hypothetical protein